MEFLYEIGLFICKAIIIVGSIGIVLALIFQRAPAQRSRGFFDLQKLNDRFHDLKFDLQSELLEKKQFKTLDKTEKKKRKSDRKSLEKELTTAEGETMRKPCVFVLDFHGDIAASATEHLREEITAVLGVAIPGDEVIVRLESGGGLVTSYGLAASQLLRLKQKQVHLTACVDKVAASGGYMMACTADRITSAPFAVLGSIGVIAQVPNVHRLLKKHDVDYQEVTAGEYKRTVTVFGEITETGMRKFKSQIEDTHTLFKNFVIANRPKVDLQKVATGEYWFGTQALELGLTDQIATSDEVILKKIEDEIDVYSLRYETKKKLAERISDSFAQAAHRLLTRLLSDARRSQFDAL